MGEPRREHCPTPDWYSTHAACFRARWLARNADAQTCALLTQPAPIGFGASIADRDTARMIAQWAYPAP